MATPWRVHAIASDFQLLDVWRYPVKIGASVPFSAFLSFLEESQRELLGGRGLTAILFRLRVALGRLFGWDEGTSEARAQSRAPRSDSVRHRLDLDERLNNDANHRSGSGPLMNFDRVYQTETEALSEIQNTTVHALLHLGRLQLPKRADTAVGDWSPQLAVYVIPRGGLGRFYMALISPFRHFIVYPAMMRTVARNWPPYAQKHGFVTDKN